MIDIREWSDETILGLAELAERDGNKERASALRAMVERRERDRQEVARLMARER